MCEPTTIMAVATLAASAYGLNEQRKSAKRNERFARAAEEEATRQDYYNRSVSAQDRAQKARAERARLRAAAAETGLAGVSTGDLLRDVDFQGGQDVALIQQGFNFDNINNRYRLQSSLNQIEQPDYIGTMANAGLSLYSAGAFTQTPQPVSTSPTPAYGPPP